MKDAERLSKAVEEFSKNDYWKEYYEKAPSELCQEYIACEFSYSLYGEKKDATRKKAIEPDLTKADWEHLLRYAGSNQHAVAIKSKMQMYGVE